MRAIANVARHPAHVCIQKLIASKDADAPHLLKEHLILCAVAWQIRSTLQEIEKKR